MRCLLFFVSAFALLASFLVMGNDARGSASPAGTPLAVPGIDRKPLAAGVLDALPPAPALVGLARVTYDPGAAEEIGIGPYGDLVSVESGALTIGTDGIATVTRSGNRSEQTGAGTDFVVGKGESAVVPGGFAVEIRNAGQTPAVVLVGFVGVVEGDPSGRPADPAGVVQQLLGLGITTAAPSAPGLLSLDHVALAANAALPIAGDAPSLTLVAMESGVAAVRCDAPLTVIHASGPPARVATGTEVTIDAGDSVLLPQHACGELRNPGPEPAQMLTLAVESEK
jgi:mannose-6-phosphate isomerase-like protein (cupin superfamily)